MTEEFDMRDEKRKVNPQDAQLPTRLEVLRDIATNIDGAYPLEALWLRNMATEMGAGLVGFDRRTSELGEKKELLGGQIRAGLPSRSEIERELGGER